MNRFEQLAKDQGIPWDDKYHWYVSKADLNRFGQLIIRECIVEMQDAFDMTIEESNHLLNHFGIE